MEHELETRSNHILKKKEPDVFVTSHRTSPHLNEQVLHLQHTIGNQATGRLLQTKLAVSHPGDAYEQEADRISQQVMSMPAMMETEPTAQRQLTTEEDKEKNKTLQKKPMAATITPLIQREALPEEEQKEKTPLQTKLLAATITPLVQRQMMTEEEKKKRDQPIQRKLLTTPSMPFVQRQTTPEEEQPVQMKTIAESMTPLVHRQAMPEEERKEEQPVQTKSTLQRAAGKERADSGADIEQQLDQSRGKGNPLPDSVRSYMEPRFGADFASVRIHTGSEASMLNRSLNAQAFTVGQDIYYGAGKSPSDLSLTAHELTHVVQQTGAVQAKAESTQQVQRTCAACAAGGPLCPKCQGEQQG